MIGLALTRGSGKQYITIGSCTPSLRDAPRTGKQATWGKPPSIREATANAKRLVEKTTLPYKFLKNILMLDVLKVRIYPNKEQEISLAKSFGCSRFVWNFYLNKTNTQYEETGKGMTYLKMAKDLTQLKKLADYEWLQEPTAAVLQQSLKNLESAFENFFAKRTGFPKFKSKHSKQSIRFPESCSIKDGGLKLPKLRKGLRV